MEGSKVEFVCTTRGKPLPEVTWFCEDEPLPLDNVWSSRNADKFEVKSVLTFPSVLLDDENTAYRIEAENAVGKYATHEFALIGEIVDYCIS